MALASHAAAKPRLLSLAILSAALILALLLHIGLGSTWINPHDVAAHILTGNHTDQVGIIVWEIRLPRACGCVVVGALLSCVGSAFQALFRNPLAEPYVVGVSSGSAVGGVLAILLGFSAWMGGLGTLCLAFTTGVGTAFLVYFLATRRGLIDVKTLLLAGVVVGSMLTGVTIAILLAAGQDTNQVLRWLSGSTTPMFWPQVLLMTLVCLAGASLLLRNAARLNALAVGEDSAHSLGVDVTRLKRSVLITGSAMTAAAVGVVGIIPFLGLIAPHIARRVTGVDWRTSLAASLLTGGIVLLVADVLAQRAVPGQELPVGVVTAIIGAPALLLLLKSDRGAA